MAATASRWLSEGNADAALKFAPTRTALAEALAEAKSTYGQTVQAGNSTATLTQQAAKNAEPAIHQIYAGATSAEQAGQASEAAQLAALPGVANTYKAEAASEAQTHLANLLGAKTRDESMLHQSGVAAREGAQFNQLNASQALRKTLTGLFQKSQTGAQEQGAFAATTAEKLAHEAETLEQRERASERSASTSTSNNQRSTGVSEANSKRSAATSTANSLRAHPGTTGGAKPVTTAESLTAGKEILTMRDYAKALAGEGLNRAQLVEHLSKGSPSVSGTTKNGAKYKTPAVKAYAPDVLMSAALDEALGGRISKNTEVRLKNAGYSVQALGLHGANSPDPKSSREAENLHRAGF